MRFLPTDLASRFTDEQTRIGELVGAAAFDNAGGNTNSVLRLGVEREYPIIHPQTGMRHLCGNDIVNTIRKPWCTREFPKCVIEQVTDPFDFRPDVFRLIHDQVLQRRGVAAVLAASHGATLGDFGLLSSFGPDDMHTGLAIVSDLPRYRALLKYLGARNGTYRMRFSGLEGPVSFDVPSSPVPAGLTAGFSPNVQFHPDVIGLAVDLSAAIAWINPLIASSSPFAAGTVAEWDSRVRSWQEGMDPECRLSPFGPGRYFGVRSAAAVMNWLAMLNGSELILTTEEAGIDEANEPFPMTRLLVGTRWNFVGRLRATLRDKVLCVHWENRLPDTGLTVADDIANAAFYVGLMSKLLTTVSSADELMCYEVAETTFRRCAETGDLETNIMWRGTGRPAGQFIRETLIPMAYDGLSSQGIDEQVARGLLSMIDRRIARKMTPAHWLLSRLRVHDKGHSRAEAVGLTLAEAAHVQAGQTQNFDHFQGVADW